jgi:hypothetical protein
MAILFSGCTETSDSLENNKTVKRNFQESEIKDLKRILDFFETQICEIDGGNGADVLQCYRNFFVRLDSAEASGNIDPKISFAQQLDLYTQLSDSTFNDIWYFSMVVKRAQTSYDTLKSVTYNDGKYAAFLKDVGRTHNAVGKYYSAFEAAGDLSPSMVALLLKLYNDYDITDIRIRLIIAVHYLTLNDQFKRREKY